MAHFRDQACTSLRSRSADLAKPMITLGMALFQAKPCPGFVEGYLMPCLQVRQTRDYRPHEVPLFLCLLVIAN